MPAQDKITQYGTQIILQAAALYLAYKTYQVTGPKTGAAVLLAASFIAYNIASIEKLWNTSAMLLNPAKSAILISCLGIIYYGLNGVGFQQLLLTGFAFFLIGGAVGALVYAYWEMGG